MGLSLAARVGVQHPERIKPRSRPDCLDPGLIGLRWAISIFIVRGYMGNRLVSHECRHVYQYEIHGSIAAFLPVYLLQIATVGYLNAPFEQDARAHELESG